MQEISIAKSLVAVVVGFGLCWGSVAIIDLHALYTEYKMAIGRQIFLFEMYLVFGSFTMNSVTDNIHEQCFSN